MNKNRLLTLYALAAFLSFPFWVKAQVSAGKAIIFGEVATSKASPSLKTKLWDSAFEMARNGNPVFDSIVVLKRASILLGASSTQTNDFSLSIPAEILPGWISFEDSLSGLSYGPFLLTTGDSIKIKLNLQKPGIYFAGPSRFGFEMVQRLNEIVERAEFESPSYLDFSMFDSYDQETEKKIKENNRRFRREVRAITERDGRLEKMEATLEKTRNAEFRFFADYYKNKVPEDKYRIILAEILSGVYRKVTYGFHSYYFTDLHEKNPELIPLFVDYFAGLEKEIDELSDKYDPSFSPSYLRMQEYRMRARAAIEGKTVLEVSDLEKRRYLREAILTGYFLQRNVIVAYGNEDLGKFIPQVEEAGHRALLEAWFNTSSAGLPVPSYPFFDQEGNSVSLHDFKGSIVLLDIWLTGCSACKYFNETHLTRLQEKYRNDPEVLIVSVSLDRNPQAWGKSLRTGIFVPKDVIHLWTGEKGMASDHPYLSHYGISSAPQLQLIDREGTLVSFGIAEKSFDVISEAIEVLKNQKIQ